MKKTLYSLMLSDEVVQQIDLLAHRAGTNRSNLVNQILAEYAHMTTPERRVSDVFKAVEALLSPVEELVPFVTPNATTMSLKSALEYKYRPTVRYEVELYRSPTDSLGELTVVFRTQSQQLLRDMELFFRLWKRVEDIYLTQQVRYALYDGKFTRSLCLPTVDCTADSLAESLSAYIRLFDSCLKGYITGRLHAGDVEHAYRELLQTQTMIL